MRLPRFFYHLCHGLRRLIVGLKVVLGLRKSPTAWLQSYNETIGYACRNYTWYLTAFLLPPVRWLFNFHLYWKKISEEKYGAPVSSVQSYDCHNEYIRRMVPRDRLIEFEPSQGWEPLCEFLGKPVPACDFPRLNDTKQMQRGFLLSLVVGGCLWTLIGLAVYGSWKAVNLLSAR
jgi:Sulfotransferase domain